MSKQFGMLIAVLTALLLSGTYLLGDEDRQLYLIASATIILVAVFFALSLPGSLTMGYRPPPAELIRSLLKRLRSSTRRKDSNQGDTRDLGPDIDKEDLR